MENQNKILKNKKKVFKFAKALLIPALIGAEVSVMFGLCAHQDKIAKERILSDYMHSDSEYREYLSDQESKYLNSYTSGEIKYPAFRERMDDLYSRESAEKYFIENADKKVVDNYNEKEKSKNKNQAVVVGVGGLSSTFAFTSLMTYASWKSEQREIEEAQSDEDDYNYYSRY